MEFVAAKRIKPACIRRNSCDVDAGGIKTRNSSKTRISGQRVTTQKSKARGGDDAVNPQSKGIYPISFRVYFISSHQLPVRVVARSFIVEFVGLPDTRIVQHIGAGDYVFCRQPMIYFNGVIIFWNNLLPRKVENAGISIRKN